MTWHRMVHADFKTVLLAPVGCTRKSEREQILPWLRKQTTYTASGGFGGNHETTHFTKHWGFWTRVDEKNISAVGEDRILASPVRIFAYDDEVHPYFLMMNEEAAADYRIELRDCALDSTRNEGIPWVGSVGLTWIP